MNKLDKMDKMKSRLNITEMDKNSKKDLFNKFESAGGKVIDMDEKKFVPAPQTSTNINRTVKIGSHDIRPEQEMSDPFSSTITVVTETIAKDNSATKIKKVSGFQVFLVRVTCMFANIFNFSATVFSQKFTRMTLEKIYAEIGVLKIVLDPIFQETTSESLKFREYMADKELLYEYELAYHTYHLLDEQWFINLKNTMPSSVDKSEVYFKLIYSRLYLFYNYHTSMQTAVHLLTQNYEKCFGKKIHNNYTPKKINDIFTSIWVEWYIWLEELLNYYLVRHNSKNPYQTLKEFLGITPNSTIKIGRLSAELKTFYKKQKEEKLLEVEGEEGSVFPSKEIQAGIEFITEKVDFQQYMDSFKDAKDLRSFFPPTDQLFYAYVLVDYFDKEYTIWNDINFYIVPGGSTGRFDAKKEIKALNNQLHQFYELVNGHLRFLRTMGMVKDAKSGQELNEKKEKEMSRNSFALKQNMLSSFEQFSTLLTQIMNSKGTAKEMVGNWEEVLLDPKNNEMKILCGKTVEEILYSAQDYISAVVWLLKYSDLSGLSGKVAEMKILTNKLINDPSNKNINSEIGL